ncbi:MAG: hypothetical protein KIS92_23770 [Planctomycetota bacterium]|nr:hypothetical protein [Planctomycetota bacterium]
MAGLYKKYSEQGFHIVGLECQGSTAAEISNMAKAKGVAYQLTTGGDLKGANVRGIPHGFLFGPDGKLVADDVPFSELEKKIKELLPEVAGAMAGPGPYKKLAPQAAQVKAGQGLGAVLKLLRTKVESKDAEEAAEAKMMLEALGGAAQAQLDRAVGMKESDPLGAIAKLDKLAVQFAGDEIAVKAKTETDALKKDPKVRKEIEAAGVFAQIEKAYDGLKPFLGEKNPKADGFVKLNQAAINNIVAGCQMIVQRYPETNVAKKAQEMMNQFK